jgi:CD63 antigen
MISNRDLQLNSGMRCAKYMLVVVSFMFALIAILLIMVGTTIQAIFGSFEQFLYENFFSPPALLIAIGFILFGVALLGACGALKESVLLINLYGVSLFLVFILEISAAIAAFLLQSQVNLMLHRSMYDSLENYHKSEYIKAGVDFMQYNLQCCGVEDPSDWNDYSDNTNGNITIIESCCEQINFEDENKCDALFEFGCFNRLSFIISQSAMLIATGATTVALVQLLGVCCAFMLAKTLRRHKSLREARRWQLQQSLGVLISGGKLPPSMNSPMTGYTQLEKAERYLDNDPVTYTPNSPSVN